MEQHRATPAFPEERPVVTYQVKRADGLACKVILEGGVAYLAWEHAAPGVAAGPARCLTFAERQLTQEEAQAVELLAGVVRAMSFAAPSTQ